MYMQKKRAHKNTVTGTSENAEFNDCVYRKSLSQLVYKNLEEVKLTTKNQYEAVLKKYPELASLYHLVKEINRIVFSKKPEKLNTWIIDAESIDNITELKSYIEGLKKDYEAVCNAIRNDYNNGLAE